MHKLAIYITLAVVIFGAGFLTGHFAYPPTSPAANEINENHFTWETALGGEGQGTTESQRFHMARLAMAGEIELMLAAIEGVVAPQVIINLPEPRAGQLADTPPSVSVTMHTTRDFTPEEGHNLALIIAVAIPDIELENITIVDQNARFIFAGDL